MPPNPKRKLGPPRRILLIRPSALGDVCRSVGVLTSLRAAYPDAKIDWLVRTGFEDAIRAHPALDDAVPFPRNELARSSKRGRPDKTLAWLNNLRKRRYDLVLDCQGLFRSGWISRWTGAKRRIGDRSAREGAWITYTKAIRLESTHTVDRMHELAQAASGADRFELTLYPPTGDLHALSERSDPASHTLRVARPQDAWRRAAQQGLLEPPYVVLAPTSIWEGKRWPIDRFVRLAERILDAKPNHRLVIVGGPSETRQCAPLLEFAKDNPRVTDLVAATSIGGLMAIINAASLVVACDSAATHIAVGLDRPLVSLYGPTDISRVGPYRREQDVIQHVTNADTLNHKEPTVGAELMRRITTEEVLEACVRRLEN